ncbi:MAG: PIG-L deacetylase family protein [Ilumatobacteraceae bacterium]
MSGPIPSRNDTARSAHPADRAVVVLAPHPDDEVFGAGALLRWLTANGQRIHLLAVTDGEAAWGPCSPTKRAGLIERRRDERSRALELLGVASAIDVTRLGLPDGGVGGREVELADIVVDLDPLMVVGPWRHDGHPDHEAVGRGALVAARRLRAPLVEYVVWAEHRRRWPPADGRRPRVVPMSRVDRAAKLRAARCFRSQLEPSPDGRPVVPAELIDRLAVGPELVLV